MMDAKMFALIKCFKNNSVDYFLVHLSRCLHCTCVWFYSNASRHISTRPHKTTVNIGMATVSKTETCAINNITVCLKSKSVILKAIYLKVFSDIVSSPPADIPIYITCKTASAVHVILKELLLHVILPKSIFVSLWTWHPCEFSLYQQHKFPRFAWHISKLWIRHHLAWTYRFLLIYLEFIALYFTILIYF